MRLGGNRACFSCHERPILATFFGVSDKNARPWEALPPQALAAFAPQLPVLVDEIIAEIRAQVPAYARPLEGAFGQGGADRRGGGAQAVQRPGGGS